jgi:hypothetical protein
VQLEAALKDAKPIQFKENIALVLKYFDKPAEAGEGALRRGRGSLMLALDRWFKVAFENGPQLPEYFRSCWLCYFRYF